MYGGGGEKEKKKRKALKEEEEGERKRVRARGERLVFSILPFLRKKNHVLSPLRIGEREGLKRQKKKKKIWHIYIFC
jgi:hypothetical protein